jgi:glycosyltransferase involved in cell wall biosynthesis
MMKICSIGILLKKAHIGIVSYNMSKSVSVCIPTFNGTKFVREQLLSILGQIDSDSEIIICDDNSTDDTVEKILALNDPRIKLTRNETRLGPVCNMENALKQAKGDLIFLSDQDDIWFPDKISAMVPFLDTYDLVISDATVIDTEGNILYPSFYIPNYSGRGFFRNWVKNSFLGCCMAFNRKVLNYVLPFPQHIAMHDIWIGLNTALVGSYCFLPQPLIYYRRHEKNATVSFKLNALPVIYQVKYRLVMMYHIIRRRIKRRHLLPFNSLETIHP